MTVRRLKAGCVCRVKKSRTMILVAAKSHVASRITGTYNGGHSVDGHTFADDDTSRPSPRPSAFVTDQDTSTGS